MALVMLLGSACQKEKEVKNGTYKIPQQQLSKVELLGPENPKNPYDRAGAIHNKVLDTLIKYVIRTRDTTRAGKHAFLKNYFDKHYGAPIVLTNSGQLENAIFTDYKSVLFSQKSSQRSKELLGFMVGILESVKQIDDYPNYKKQFVALEQLISSEKFPGNEKEMLLSTAALFRHSGYFWMDFFQNNEKVESWGLLRKLAGMITGVAADATSWFYYGFTSGSFYQRLEDTINMSECCGYYTGWY